MEREIKPGVFIGSISKVEHSNKLAKLDGDDKRHFIEKCNPFVTVTNRGLSKTLGLTVVDLYYTLLEIDPDFNVREDFYTVRLAPVKEGA